MNGPLKGKRIVVTRPAAQATKLIGLIAAQGAEALAVPLLDIAPCADAAALREAMARLGDYAIVFFVSPNAVAYSLPLLRARGGWPGGARAAAIGRSTAAALLAEGVGPVIVPEARFDSEALLDLPELSAARITGSRLLIVRGNGGRELLATTLRARGAIVDEVAAYERTPAREALAIVSLLRNTRVDALTVSSSEGLRNLFAMLDTKDCERLRSTPTFVPHQRIAAVAAELGLRRVILTAPEDAGIIAGLCEYNWLSHE